VPAPSQRAASLALPALLLGAVGIAFAPIFVRLSEVGPVATGFWRMLLALPVLGAAAAWQRTRVRARQHTGSSAAASPAGTARRHDSLWLAAAGLCFAGDLALWHLSIGFTSVANATLLANLAPIFVTLGGWWFLRQRVTPGFMLALGLALAGVWVLLGASAGDGGQRVAGDLLGVGTAVFYAGYILCVADLRGRCSTVSILWASGAAACPPLLLVAVLSGEALLPVDARGWWVLIGLALVSQVAGQGLIAYSLAHLPAALSSLTLLLQPVCAALFAWALLAEALGARQALGGAVVLAGVALARRASRPPGLRRPAPPPSRP
jgi:drug/metabolite transporter (DMT)-like permease